MFGLIIVGLVIVIAALDAARRLSKAAEIRRDKLLSSAMQRARYRAEKRAKEDQYDDFEFEQITDFKSSIVKSKDSLAASE